MVPHGHQRGEGVGSFEGPVFGFRSSLIRCYRLLGHRKDNKRMSYEILLWGLSAYAFFYTLCALAVYMIATCEKL